MTEESLLERPYELRLPCIRVTQPIGEFFIASISCKDLCEITLADVRRIYREREVETYLGIQRPLNANRVKEIQQYTNTVDACFPTGVILAIEGRCAEYDSNHRELVLRSDLASEDPEARVKAIQIAKVLDGQHRIEGLRAFRGTAFDVNVSIFIDMDIESQAYLFSTVNLAQTKVNKSLVYDLFEYAKARSPQRTCHNIAVALDTLETSPFYHRIKRLGSTTEGRFGESITQASFVEALLPYLTDNKLADRDLYLRGKKPPRANDAQGARLIFRGMFLDERDMEIADIILNYFESIKRRWPTAWASNAQGAMLSKTNGFQAMMRVLRPLYLRLKPRSEVPSIGEFSAELSHVKLDDADFSVERFKPGTSGQSSLYAKVTGDLKL